MRPAAAAGGYPWALVGWVAGAGIVSACQVGKVPLALPVLRDALGLALSDLSWLLSGIALVGALFGIAAGLVVDRLGPRRLVLAGLLVQGLAGAAAALDGGFPLLLASRLLEGLGFVAVVVAAPALIHAVLAGREPGPAFAVWATFMPAGITLVSLGGPLLEASGWRGFWGLNALALLVYAGALALRSRGLAMPVAARSEGGELGALLKSAMPWLLGLLFAAFCACYFAVFGFLPTLLGARWGLGVSATGALTGLAVAVGAAGNLAAGALLARGLAAPRLLALAFAGLGLSGAGIFAGALPPGAAFALAVLFSALGGLIPPALFTLAAQHARERMGTMQGWLMQGNNLGLLLGPLVAGALVARLGWWAVSLLVAGLAAASVVATGWLRPRPAPT
ncbi:MFS transporter [Roseateles sp. DAIF2]|uniref:MFS transporter n=1 Tax=Roseateles sp. DAIF2 TaxID=2714952 RepID=UPI0018A2E0F3|nr:MFS transporter [Roseateles sp. DAIF2]QPF72859.1 MFS transporter [Roseateles sp. DAIF2]